jgi:hypothetical protein
VLNNSPVHPFTRSPVHPFTRSPQNLMVGHLPEPFDSVRPEPVEGTNVAQESLVEGLCKQLIKSVLS